MPWLGETARTGGRSGQAQPSAPGPRRILLILVSGQQDVSLSSLLLKLAHHGQPVQECVFLPPQDLPPNLISEMYGWGRGLLFPFKCSRPFCDGHDGFHVFCHH